MIDAEGLANTEAAATAAVSKMEEYSVLANAEYRVITFAGDIPAFAPASDVHILGDIGIVAAPVDYALPPDVAPLSTRVYPGMFVNWLRAINYCQTHKAAAMNMSFGPVGQLPHSADDPDPLYVALERSARNGPLAVVAAGNRHGDDTLQFLARSPFALSAGAVDDAGVLLPYSARGPVGGIGPTVVANGFSKRRDGAFAQAATSFAAPRVTVIVVWMRTIFEYIIDCLRQLIGGTWEPFFGFGVPIVAIVGDGIDQAAFDAIRTAEPQWISRMPAHRTWLRGICTYFDKNHGIKSRVDTGVDGIRRALSVIARPLPGTTTAESGAGFISSELFYDALRDFTPELWVRLFADDIERAAQIEQAEFDAVNAHYGPLFDEAFAEILIAQCVAGPGIHVLRVM